MNVREITITKQADSSSPQLYAACVNGAHLGTAEISILLPAVQTGVGDEYWKYRFNDIAISQFETGGNFGGSPLPVETIKFEYGQVAFLLPAV